MSSISNKEYFFVYEEESPNTSFSIKLTEMGWDMLSVSERKRLWALVAGKKQLPQKWNHCQWGNTVNEAAEPYAKDVEKWRKKNGK
ncbi:hypothetical protein [Anaerorhabdus sp.]|uniref:hypothetical protein n=1 Tax=Anaerorhabdus sp. TaxID=1872524 RepID=UPI002FCC5EB4